MNFFIFSWQTELAYGVQWLMNEDNLDLGDGAPVILTRGIPQLLKAVIWNRPDYLGPFSFLSQGTQEHIRDVVNMVIKGESPKMFDSMLPHLPDVAM